MKHRKVIEDISIHTPVKGVTSHIIISYLYQSYFNPHTREGCDLPKDYTDEDIWISIHTPVKGVT